VANRRKDRKVPEGFVRYDGTYDKAFYTVVTFSGSTYENIWPNAGRWGVGNGRYLHTHQIFAIKKKEGYIREPGTNQ